MSGEMKDYGAIRRLYTPKNGTRVTEVRQLRHYLRPYPRSFKLHNTMHAPFAVAHLVPIFYRVLIGACNSMLCPIWGCR